MNGSVERTMKLTPELVRDIATNLEAPNALVDLLIERWFHPRPGVGVQLGVVYNRDQAVVAVNRGLGSLWASS